MPTRPADPPATPLAEVVRWLEGQVRVEVVGADPVPGPPVTGCTLSTARVRPGDLYAALPGARAHGADYAADAVAAGAVAVLTDADGAARARDVAVPLVVVPQPRAVLGRLAAHLYGEPATRMVMLGVTGTQGKTTTTRLLEGGLQAAGTPAAVVGTVGTRIDGESVETSLTTPEAPDLHGLFALMRERGVAVCALEVSSHALVLGRVDGVVFDVACFLNLGRDHLDFHDDVEDYYRAKASLFTAQRCRRALVDVDDEHGRRLVQELRRAGEVPVRTVSAGGAAADWRAEDVRLEPGGSTFTLVTPDGARLPARAPLPGGFNVANTLMALAAAAEGGFDPAAVAAGIAAAGGVPGRLERVEVPQPVSVVVDYAHKPDAVRAVLETLRPVTSGALVVVLGAGGDRDPGKRPLMGEIAAELADVLVVTDDNPRTEDPAAIRGELVAGAHAAVGAGSVVEVEGRRAAIEEGLRRAVAAGPGSTLLVAGKGHETGQEVQGVVHPFDDRTVVAEVAAGLGPEAP